ncbi:hypothetical protein [Pseudomonas sp. UMAB-40]|uniref:ParB/RepB/Spo0J family partition protein n=1 Tax=Pseudomonas sp. UMAB-40 TaxID=1365407 RepID=UPI001C559F6E|nr:hypothetical protein [Pseudomonas sp. UMAB-40]
MAATTKTTAANKSSTAAKPASKSAAKTASAQVADKTPLANAVAPSKPSKAINTLSAYKAYTDDDVTRVDGYSMKWEVIEEEEGFNPRNYDDPDLVAHIRKMADGYKRGDVFPHLFIVIRNGTPYVRDGHCRLRAIKLAVSEGATIGKVPVVEVKGDEVAQADLVLMSQEGQKLKPLERAAHYVKYHNWDFSDAEIGKRFNKTGEHVRQYRSMLELPIALKKLITDGTITPTLALDLYKEHGSDSVDLVKQAAEIQRKDLEAATDKATTAGVAALVTGDLLDVLDGSVETVVHAAEVQAPESAVVASATDSGVAPVTTAQESASTPPEPAKPAKPKVMKKHIDRLVGAAPKLSKQVVASMTRSFTGLSSRIESVRLIDDKFFLEVSAEDLELLKQLKAQMTEPAETQQSDPNQLDILANAQDQEDAAA